MHELGPYSIAAAQPVRKQFSIIQDHAGCHHRRIVPYLSIRPPLAKLPDEIGGLTHHRAHRIVHFGISREEPNSQRHLREPDRLEIGGEKQSRRSQHIVLIGNRGIHGGVRDLQLDATPSENLVVKERSQHSQMQHAFGQPQVIPPSPVGIVPVSPHFRSTLRTSMHVGAQGIEGQARSIAGAHAAIACQPRLAGNTRNRVVEYGCEERS